MKKNNNQLLMTLLKGRTFIVLIILIIFFSIASSSFLQLSTLTMVAKHVALYGILALGMTFVIITGGIDLSVGSVVGLVGMLAGGLLQDGQHHEHVDARRHTQPVGAQGLEACVAQALKARQLGEGGAAGAQVGQAAAHVHGA